MKTIFYRQFRNDEILVQFSLLLIKQNKFQHTLNNNKWKMDVETSNLRRVSQINETKAPSKSCIERYKSKFRQKKSRRSSEQCGPISLSPPLDDSISRRPCPTVVLFHFTWRVPAKGRTIGCLFYWQPSAGVSDYSPGQVTSSADTESAFPRGPYRAPGLVK